MDFPETFVTVDVCDHIAKGRCTTHRSEI